MSYICDRRGRNIFLTLWKRLKNVFKGSSRLHYETPEATATAKITEAVMLSEVRILNEVSISTNSYSNLVSTCVV
jgi:hypothetical protein